MANEAKFSVIFPAALLSHAQIETFEETAQRNGLPVSLPLRTDDQGNLLISSGLSLRDAQILRRQISGYGFNADVISDNVNVPSKGQNSDGSPSTLVVELNRAEALSQSKPAEHLSEALASMDIPNLDLGLSDADVLDGAPEDWDGDNWLDPDASASRTLSVNAQALLEAAMGMQNIDPDEIGGDVPLLETLTKNSLKIADPEQLMKIKAEQEEIDQDDQPTVTNLKHGEINIEFAPKTDLNDVVPELNAESSMPQENSSEQSIQKESHISEEKSHGEEKSVVSESSEKAKNDLGIIKSADQPVIEESSATKGKIIKSSQFKKVYDVSTEVLLLPPPKFEEENKGVSHKLLLVLFIVLVALIVAVIAAYLLLYS